MYTDHETGATWPSKKETTADQELLTAQSIELAKLREQLIVTREAFVRFARKSTQTWREADELVDELLKATRS